ncbi:hypothetical protein M976_00280 [Buttiauxella ferragutiae ATCC 51602]|jgi:hypothetical protein|uniref:Transposase n=1 Tax=Buttiauxella ferragutiae ATCC 51602 TaxID=1354252 RepID=A0ABX2WEH7_9ENTR|nr:hypothetical protein M976_00280 [Buttiauxella ferragutiae ATCC 51602]
MLFASPGIELGLIQAEFTGNSSHTNAFSKLKSFLAELRRMLLAG